jgi:hypothetical protein
MLAPVGTFVGTGRRKFAPVQHGHASKATCKPPNRIGPEMHIEGLLSYAVTRMTNGRMEGINRKIKTMLRQFYGLRDADFLRLKLYALHESKHKLVG